MKEQTARAATVLFLFGKKAVIIDKRRQSEDQKDCAVRGKTNTVIDSDTIKNKLKQT